VRLPLDTGSNVHALATGATLAQLVDTGNLAAALGKRFGEYVDKFVYRMNLLPQLLARLTTLGRMATQLPYEHPSFEPIATWYTALLETHETLRQDGARIQAEVSQLVENARAQGASAVLQSASYLRLWNALRPWMRKFDKQDSDLVRISKIAERLLYEVKTPEDVRRILNEPGGDARHPSEWRTLIRDIPRGVLLLGLGVVVLLTAPDIAHVVRSMVRRRAA